MKKIFTFFLLSFLALTGFKSVANPFEEFDGSVSIADTHTITVVQPAVGGTISVSANEATAGTPIYIYTNPAQGYKLNKWYVKKESGEVVMEDVAIGFYMLNFNITVTADFVSESQNLTVNDGMETNYDVLFNSSVTNNFTKSQFIIPASDLVNMYDGTITNLTFYHNQSNNFTFSGSWNVYIKEVDYTEIQNNDYFPTTANNLVYTGNLSFYNNMLTIALSQSYQYNDGNLMICFEQINQGNCLENTQWYGVGTQGNTSRGGCDYNSGSGYHGNNSFLPKTTFGYIPSANPQTRYAITVNQPEIGGTISASKALAVEGCTIKLTATPAENYILDQWIVTDEEGIIAVTDNQFAMRTSDVTVTAVFKTLPHYITIIPNEHGTIKVNDEETPDENGYSEGTRINLSAQGNEGWALAENGYTVTPEDPTVTVEIQQEWDSYYFMMPACNVTISSTFRELGHHTVTYHVNGVESQETVYEGEYFYPSQPTIPVGTEWYNWITEDLEDANTIVQPENIFLGGEITEDMDLYAVFKFVRTVPVEGPNTWEQVSDSNQLVDGDHVVMVAYYFGYYYLLTKRDSEDAVNFNSTSSSISSEDLANGNWSNDVTIFTALSESNNWKFKFKDAFSDEETYLADYNGNLVPVYKWGGDDVWLTYNDCFLQNAITNHYIYFHNIRNSGKYFDLNYSSSARNTQLYKEVEPMQTNYYYMTSILTEGEVADTTVKNIIVANPITVSGKLTMDENGIFVNDNVANFVFKDGAEFIYTGTETVNATFEKEINGYNAPSAIGDGWYFIANPTDNPTVNLKDEDGDFDLYSFNPAEEQEWQNEQYENYVQIPEEDIEISRKTGYLYANRDDFTLRFAGELITSDDETIDLVCAGAGEGLDFPGFNLVGNPYPRTAYISTEFDMFKLVNGSEVQISDDYTVAPCEAFFLEATQSVIVSTTAPEEKSHIMSIVVNNDRGETLDRAILHLEGTTNSHKFMMNPDHTNISFAKNGERFASVSRGNEAEIPMNFTADHKGTYTISFNTEDFEEEYLHLIDVISGDNIDLLVTPNYTFEADADEYASRFRIVFGTTDINDDPATSSEPFVYISNGNLVINDVEGTASMQIVDMLGRIVRTETVSGNYNQPHNLKAGAYVITLDGKAQRIVIE